VSPARFEKINGHEPVVFPQRGGTFRAVCTCGCNGGLPAVLSASAATEKKVLKLLLEEVYRHHSKIVMTRQGWRCLACDRNNPGLEIDHIHSRARGERDDRLPNLRAICSGPDGCGAHQRKHG
jgi:5-methylcytosine-specific restriction endonuclease McrA